MKRITTFHKALLVTLVLCVLRATPASALTFVSERTWGGADSEVDARVAVAPDGSVYLAGETRSFGVDSPTSTNIFLLKYDADGTLAWQWTWSGPGSPFVNDEVGGIAVAPDGMAVYVTGAASGDVVLLKFDPNGTLVWDRTWGGTGFEHGEGVAVAADGSVYVAGGTERSFRPASNDSGDLFVVKFDPAGTVVWQKIWGTELDGEGGQGVAVALDGNVYVAGVGPRPGAVGGGADTVLLKLDPSGNLMWQRAYSAGDSVDARGGVTVGPDNSIYVAGAIFEPDRGITDLDALLVKFTPVGDLAWDRSWGGGQSGDDASGVAASSDGTLVFLVGSTNSFGAGSDDAYIVALSANTGKALDAMTWGNADLDKGNGIAIAPDGTLFLAATAETAPPYIFDRTSTKTSRLRGTVATPAGALTSVTGALVDPAGVVEVPAGRELHQGAFDAALVRVRP